MRVSRRRFLVAAATLSASALLAACRGEATPTPAPQPTPTPAAAGQQPAATPTPPSPAATPTVVETLPKKKLRFGYAVALSGPLAAGAVGPVNSAKMWVDDVNAAGGIRLEDGVYEVELLLADDQSNPEECIRQVQRLITQEKVDFFFAPYGTGLNHAVAPLLHQNGYPQPAVATWVTEEDARRFPYYVSYLGRPEQYAEEGIIGLLKYLADQGKIGRRVAIPYVDAEFGLLFVTPLRPALQAAGFEIVYDQGYPMEIGDMQPIMSDIMQRNPDAVIALSYPADTMLFIPAMKVLGFNPAVFYAGVGTQFSFFKNAYGDDIEGIFSMGGIDPNNQKLLTHMRRYRERFNDEIDRWGGPLYYAVGEIYQQALERIGKVDRRAVAEEIKNGTFDTVVGPITLTGNAFLGNWLVGQWQRLPDGTLEFLGIMPRERSRVEPIAPKPQWKS